MGRYMTVVLKQAHQNDLFINDINMQLNESFDAIGSIHFITWQYLQSEADFMNTDPEGLQQIPHIERPITAIWLHTNFFWYRVGEFAFKLSGCSEVQEAFNAVAVCKWLSKTRCKYIDKSKSDNYQPAIVADYLNHLFVETGHDPFLVWNMPT